MREREREKERDYKLYQWLDSEESDLLERSLSLSPSTLPSIEKGLWLFDCPLNYSVSMIILIHVYTYIYIYI